MIARGRAICFPDALSLAGVGLAAAGMVVTGDGLVAAAHNGVISSSMSWHERLLLGLWTFRLEHTLWFTLGLVVLWVGMGLGGRLGRSSDTVARLVGGVAIGHLLLAAAVVVGATIVAATGSVGGSGIQATFSGRERLATWLLQVATALALGLVWGLAGTRLGERFAPFAAGPSDDRDEPSDDGESDGHREIDDFELLEQIELPPPPPPQPRTAPVAPLPVAEISPPPATAAPPPSPPTPSVRARRRYEEQLSFSPMRDEARKLVEQVTGAERAGRVDEASALADRLDAM